ncbi:MAG: alkaline phosphatase [Tannerella sp.]|jgi:alkaline phosphatase|nr:alkaline phosphatase [Tannerella sp.]
MTRKFIFKLFFSALSGIFATALSAQSIVSVMLEESANQPDVLIHSHNDYLREAPFYQAHAQRVASVEADIYCVPPSDSLLVAHTRAELRGAPTLNDSYIEPIVNLYRQNGGRAWKNSDRTLQWMIDLKTPAVPTLDRLVEALRRYPEVFDPEVNPQAVRVVITGNVPEPGDFDRYPAFVSFDGLLREYTPAQLSRIALISLNLADYTRWNGKGRMVAGDHRKVAEAIEKAHALGKPIRFWGTPDGVTAWNTFHNMGVDYINTDRPEACAAFFRELHKKTFRIADGEEVDDDVARAGFRNKDLQLSERIGIYRPARRNDGAKKKVKNVILLIGDGMGMAQICAADIVNNGLTLLQMKYIGLLNTEAEDALTTDSAAGGSALATGKKHRNRHISVGAEGEILPSLTDVFHENGYACGVVTLGNIADATPAAFYGHAADRDHVKEILSFLPDGKLDLLNGSGGEALAPFFGDGDPAGELKKTYTLLPSIEDIHRTKGKVICIDERMDRATTEETLSLLADATRQAVRKLSAESAKGFFLMVEGARIDHAGHANSLPGSILETLGFDLAVAEALKFADGNGETLVIVTADHETGGLTLVDGNRDSESLTVQYMSNDHTPLYVPLFAYGPAANEFCGAYQNTALFHKIKNAVRIK